TSGAGAATGSSDSVHVSAVSRSRPATRNGSGAIAPPCSAGAVAINVQKSQPGRLQSLDRDLREPAHQVVPQSGVGVRLLAQAGRIERRRAHAVDRAAVEVPAI